MAASVLSSFGAKPPSSPTAVEQALLLEHGLQGVEDLRDGAQALGEGAEALGHDHEFLEIDRRIGVGAAVDDVRHAARAGPWRWARRGI